MRCSRRMWKKLGQPFSNPRAGCPSFVLANKLCTTRGRAQVAGARFDDHPSRRSRLGPGRAFMANRRGGPLGDGGDDSIPGPKIGLMTMGLPSLFDHGGDKPGDTGLVAWRADFFRRAGTSIDRDKSAPTIFLSGMIAPITRLSWGSIDGWPG